ncbi:hypothetical protein FNV43_RR14555 [Rhamnella rubrinervis]|uniref:Uncharacterized protein n=1 Tax=Rhamnella rubrinervis TaxID=2594499 RepID=A0A8K0MGF4_9ROSA|nr:hypothetical protein FNV43_RR14555 [Rhamnella rubrinervis]
MDVMRHENRKGSSKQLKVHFDLPNDYHDEVDLSSPTRSSISSASSALSMEPSVVDKDVGNPFELKQDSPEFQGSYSSPEEVSRQVSPTPPPMAGRPSGYDPNRIPSSIFSKPSTPMEWSVASNESLFSINVGTSSFSRDHLILMQRSGELTKLDDLINIPPPPISTEANVVESKNFNLEKKSDEIKAPTVVSEAGKINSKEGPEHHITDKMSSSDGVPNSGSLSHRSEESNNSTRSFQFPVLAGDGGRNSPLKMLNSVKPQKPEEKTQQQEQEHDEEHAKMVEHEEPPKMKQQDQPATPKKPHKAGTNDWFNLFSCFWVCR